MPAQLTADNLLIQNRFPITHRDVPCELLVDTHQIILPESRHLIAAMVVEVPMAEIIDAASKYVAEYVMPDDRDIEIFEWQVGKKLSEVNGTSTNAALTPKACKTRYFEILKE